MHSRVLSVLVVVLAAVPPVGGTDVGLHPCWRPAASVPLTDPGCAPLVPPQLSCWQPEDVEGGLAQPTLSVRQRATDLFAWQLMVALNWPADPRRPGEPDPRRSLDAPGRKVWETYRDVDSVFLPAGRDPGPWEQTPQVPERCTAAGATRVLHRTAKVDDLFDATVQPTGASAILPPVLTDQQGRAVRYDIRVNRVAYEYLRDSGLYDGAVQAVTDGVAFPAGSMLVKSAWRPLGDGPRDRYLAERACVCDQDADHRPVDCEAQWVGLVGFHLMVKTASAPQWIWATFEQVDNVPADARESAGESGAGSRSSYAFFDPTCPAADCPPNRVRPAGTPTQVRRAVPIPDREPDCGDPADARDDVVALNADLARALVDVGSVLAYYQLVGAQWPVHPPAAPPASAPSTVFEVLPTRLGNTTLETFIQPSSSCMGCHAMARTNRLDQTISADFTFTLNDARPFVPPPAVGPPDAASLVGVDAAAQALIQRGYQLATATHELRPDVAVARMHCSSCHLDAGRNPAAAWWVDMARYFPVDPRTPPAPPGITLLTLQGRINQCFERSMNGQPLCMPGVGEGSCATDADMAALIAYMHWVTTRYLAPGQPARGFPALAAGTGDADRGRAVYAQKCAFCHGEAGQGRDQDGVYYRPPLWGPRSFNAAAGLAKPATLAAFVHANMPLGSGGVLTPQEAWDLAAFIDSQCRPGRDCPAALRGTE